MTIVRIWHLAGLSIGLGGGVLADFSILTYGGGRRRAPRDIHLRVHQRACHDDRLEDDEPRPLGMRRHRLELQRPHHLVALVLRPARTRFRHDEVVHASPAMV